MNDLYGEELFENGPLNCRHCAKNRKLAKTTKLANCPAVLLFQIQRICVCLFLNHGEVYNILFLNFRELFCYQSNRVMQYSMYVFL